MRAMLRHRSASSCGALLAASAGCGGPGQSLHHTLDTTPTMWRYGYCR
jgi:hypothetical protein